MQLLVSQRGQAPFFCKKKHEVITSECVIVFINISLIFSVIGILLRNQKNQVKSKQVWNIKQTEVMVDWNKDVVDIEFT